MGDGHFQYAPLSDPHPVVPQMVICTVTIGLTTAKVGWINYKRVVSGYGGRHLLYLDLDST